MSIAARLLVTLLSCATAVTVFVGTSNTALAADAYPWPHNGCTGVPDTASTASFYYACNHHDGCYAKHWADRLTCDNWFLNDMMAECNRIPWPTSIPTLFDPVRSCRNTARVYYNAVRLVGQYFYDSNGDHVRISTPMRVA